MTLEFDKKAIETLMARHGEEYVLDYLKCGYRILSRYLEANDKVYVIVEPNNDSAKQVIYLGAVYIRPSVDENGRKAVAKIILKEN